MDTAEKLKRFEAMDTAAATKASGQPADSPVAPCPLRDWVAVELLFPNGTPAAGASYILTLPDGSERTGTLDAQGYAIERDIEKPGECKVRFPDFPEVRRGS